MAANTDYSIETAQKQLSESDLLFCLRLVRDIEAHVHKKLTPKLLTYFKPPKVAEILEVSRQTVHKYSKGDQS